MNVKQIIIKFMDTCNYSGLCHPDPEVDCHCIDGCKGYDLMHCGELPMICETMVMEDEDPEYDNKLPDNHCIPAKYIIIEYLASHGFNGLFDTKESRPVYVIGDIFPCDSIENPKESKPYYLPKDTREVLVRKLTMCLDCKHFNGYDCYPCYGFEEKEGKEQNEN